MNIYYSTRKYCNRYGHCKKHKEQSDYPILFLVYNTSKFNFVHIFLHSITHTYLYAHQQFNHPYLPVDPNAPVPRSSHDSKVKSGIRTGLITSCPTLSPILSSAATASCLQSPAHNEAYPDQFSFRSAHPSPHRHPDCLDQLP